MTIKLRPFDPAAYLKTAKDRAAYMNEALKSGDPSFIADAVGVIARAKGMTKVAKDAGLSRESLYRALSPEGNPEFATMLKVLGALDMKLKMAPGQPK